MIIKPMVVDMFSGEHVEDFAEAYAFGIRGIIHKATEGRSFSDATYRARRKLACDDKLLWGAYHFFRPGDVKEQVDHFISVAEPDALTLMALDHEDERVDAEAAREFMQRLADKLGRKPVLYSGHLIKQQLDTDEDEFFGGHRLWHAQYGARWSVQDSWEKPWLWQFTGDGIGPEPHRVPGIAAPGKGLDINHYDGTPEQLATEWAG
jgi:lysozyme